MTAGRLWNRRVAQLSQENPSFDHKDHQSVGVPTPPFEIRVRRAGDRAIVVPEGEIDLATADDVEARLQDLRAEGWRNLVLDLRDVSFIDSSGLRLLVRMQNASQADEFDFSIVDGTPVISRVLEISGLSGIFARADPAP